MKKPHIAANARVGGEIISGLSLPWIKDSFIVELRPGRIVLGKERFPISMTRKGKYSLGFPLLGKEEIDLFHQALLSHLETAGLANVLS